MSRRCGNCRFAEPTGDFVLCFGAPPTVTAVETSANSQNVTAHIPVLGKARRPCALHRYRWFKRKAA